MSKNICKTHQVDFSDIVACNDCNMLGGYMLHCKKSGAVYTQQDRPTLWPTKESATEYARKFALAKMW